MVTVPTMNQAPSFVDEDEHDQDTAALATANGTTSRETATNIEAELAEARAENERLHQQLKARNHKKARASRVDDRREKHDPETDDKYDQVAVTKGLLGAFRFVSHKLRLDVGPSARGGEMSPEVYVERIIRARAEKCGVTLSQEFLDLVSIDLIDKIDDRALTAMTLLGRVANRLAWKELVKANGLEGARRVKSKQPWLDTFSVDEAQADGANEEVES